MYTSIQYKISLHTHIHIYIYIDIHIHMCIYILYNYIHIHIHTIHFLYIYIVCTYLCVKLISDPEPHMSDISHLVSRMSPRSVQDPAQHRWCRCPALWQHVRDRRPPHRQWQICLRWTLRFIDSNNNNNNHSNYSNNHTNYSSKYS